MANTTSIHLGDHFTGFLSTLTDEGRFKNASEAVRAGLRLLEEQETEYQTKLVALRKEIDEGDASGESARTWEEIIDEAKAELKAERNAK